MLVLPWGFHQSGLVAGAIECVVIGSACTYTAVLVYKHGKRFGASLFPRTPHTLLPLFTDAYVHCRQRLRVHL